MPQIDWINEKDATGDVAKLYEGWMKANPDRGQMPDILKCFSQNAGALRGIMSLSYETHFNDGALSKRQKEMIATYVSALNQCPY